MAWATTSGVAPFSTPPAAIIPAASPVVDAVHVGQSNRPVTDVVGLPDLRSPQPSHRYPAIDQACHTAGAGGRPPPRPNATQHRPSTASAQVSCWTSRAAAQAWYRSGLQPRSVTSSR